MMDNQMGDLSKIKRTSHSIIFSSVEVYHWIDIVKVYPIVLLLHPSLSYEI